MLSSHDAKEGGAVVLCKSDGLHCAISQLPRISEAGGLQIQVLLVLSAQPPKLFAIEQFCYMYVSTAIS